MIIGREILKGFREEQYTTLSAMDILGETIMGLRDFRLIHLRGLMHRIHAFT